MSDLQSRPYKPHPAHCCERCVFGSGEHAEWCVEYVKSVVASAALSIPGVRVLGPEETREFMRSFIEAVDMPYYAAVSATLAPEWDSPDDDALIPPGRP